MFGLFALILACETPKPLPPKKNDIRMSDTRMVQMDSFRGYLARPSAHTGTEAVLIVADSLDEASRKQVNGHPGQIVLVIESDDSIEAASRYLVGLPTVKDVKRICIMSDCTGMSRPLGDPR